MSTVLPRCGDVAGVGTVGGWSGGRVGAVLSSFGDGRLFGERTGDGPPWVLALHGWGRSKGDFREVLAPRRTRVADDAGDLAAIALDLPGFGSSPEPPDAWGADQYAAAIAPVLDEMADEVVVLGHSFGGRVALKLACTRPDRIAGLVFAGVPLYRIGARRRPAVGYRLVRGANRVGLVGDGRLEAARRRYGSADYRAATGVLRDVLVKAVGEDYGHDVARVACRVELVWGDGDTVAPPAVATRAAAELAHAHLVLLEGIGHLTPTEAPGELRAALLRLRP